MRLVPSRFTLAFHNKLPFAISVAPYSQNQTSIKNFKFKPSEFRKSCEESCYKSNTQVVFSPLFNSYKSRRKNLLDASVVLIQVFIRSPVHKSWGSFSSTYLEIKRKFDSMYVAIINDKGTTLSQHDFRAPTMDFKMGGGGLKK